MSMMEGIEGRDSGGGGEGNPPYTCKEKAKRNTNRNREDPSWLRLKRTKREEDS